VRIFSCQRIFADKFQHISETMHVSLAGITILASSSAIILGRTVTSAAINKTKTDHDHDFFSILPACPENTSSDATPFTVTSFCISSRQARLGGISLEIEGDFIKSLSIPQTLATFTHESLAHEGPVFVQETNSLYFTSNRLASNSSFHSQESTNQSSTSIQISLLNLSNGSIFTNLPISVPMANGATLHPSKDAIYFCGQGSFSEQAGIFLYNLTTSLVSPVLTSFNHVHLFNSPNDVIAHPTKPLLFFTVSIFTY
jgi:hypothetical protein